VFTRRLFGELTRGLLGPANDGNIIILSDSGEEDETCEEITTDVEAAPPSAVNSLAPTISATDADDTSKGKQDDNSDGGDEAGSPLAAMPKRVFAQSRR
jgi:hypothetical protein